MCAFLLLPTLHNYLVRYVKEHTVLVVKLQSVARCGALDRLATTFTLLGHTQAYLLLIPLIAWNLDLALGRKLMVLWALGLYIANCLKDLLLLPRPRLLNERVQNLDRLIDKYAAFFRQYLPSLGANGRGAGGSYAGNGRTSVMLEEHFGLPCRSTSMPRPLLPSLSAQATFTRSSLSRVFFSLRLESR